MSIEELLKEYNENGWSTLVEYESFIEDVYEIYSLLKKNNYKELVDELLKYLASEWYYQDSDFYYENNEENIMLLSELMDYSNDVVWLWHIGEYLYENDNPLAFKAFSLGSKFIIKHRSFSYSHQADPYDAFNYCKMYLGKCYFYGKGTKRDMMLGLKMIKPIVGLVEGDYGSEYIRYIDYGNMVETAYANIKKHPPKELNDFLNYYFKVKVDEDNIEEYKNLQNLGKKLKKEVYNTLCQSTIDYSNEEWFIKLERSIK